MGMLGSEMDGAYQNQAAMLDDGCCEVSYQPSQVTQASGASAQSQQVLLLDAAQPPPIWLAFSFPGFGFIDRIPITHGVHFEPDASSPFSAKPVYLLTRRLRI